MIRVSLRLISRSHDFLTGAWTGAADGPQGRDVAGITQPLTPAEEEKMRAFILGHPGVTGIRQLLVTFVGPGRRPSGGAGGGGPRYFAALRRPGAAGHHVAGDPRL